MVRSDHLGLLYQLLRVSRFTSYTRNASVYLAVSDFETSMDEKAWFLVRFIPVHGMGVTREMVRVQCEASVDDRRD